MTSQDFIVGAILSVVILFSAYFFRVFFTDEHSRKFFIPALGVRMVCAILLGLLYQYYYVGEGGDTFGYFYGAKRIWGFFNDDPVDAFRIIFWDGNYGNGIYRLVSRLPHFIDSSAFIVDRIAGFLGLFAFGNYTGIALLFSLISFSGSWALFSSIRKLYPGMTNYIAISILFIPSVVFWGSGILKDTLTLAAMSWMIWSFVNVVYFKRKRVFSIIIFLISLFIIFKIKSYILIVLIPSMLLWYYRVNISRIRSNLFRYALTIIMILILAVAGFQIAPSVLSDESKYSIDNVIRTVNITAYDIRYWTGSGAGSGYDLGQVPETRMDMIRLFPNAVNVSLFRPYLWEVNGALMLLMSIESFAFLSLTLILIFKYRLRLIRIIYNDPFILFTVVFVIGFGYAVGISTWNFGTLLRYKIPLLPLFASSLIVSFFYKKGQPNNG